MPGCYGGAVQFKAADGCIIKADIMVNIYSIDFKLCNAVMLISGIEKNPQFQH